MRFLIDWKAFWGIIFLLAVTWFFIKKRNGSRKNTALYFSDLKGLQAFSSSLRSRFFHFPFYLLVTSLISFMVGFLDPHFLIKQDWSKSLPSNAQKDLASLSKPSLEEVSIPTEGIAIYLLLDRSSSMQSEMDFIDQEGHRKKLSRIEVLKQVSTSFVKGLPSKGLLGRSSDLIGVVAFARIPTILAPLTLDHDYVLEHLNTLKVAELDSEDGTAIGYAIFKVAHLIEATKLFAQKTAQKNERASYDIKNSVLIVVTDGQQNPHPLDRANNKRTMSILSAARYAQKENIKLYIIHIDPETLASAAEERKELQAAAQITGGHFYTADNITDLELVYGDIDRLEKSLLPIDKKIMANVQVKGIYNDLPIYYNRISLYPYFIELGLFCLLLGVFLETTWLRRIP